MKIKWAHKSYLKSMINHHITYIQNVDKIHNYIKSNQNSVDFYTSFYDYTIDETILIEKQLLLLFSFLTLQWYFLLKFFPNFIELKFIAFNRKKIARVTFLSIVFIGECDQINPKLSSKIDLLFMCIICLISYSLFDSKCPWKHTLMPQGAYQFRKRRTIIKYKV